VNNKCKCIGCETQNYYDNVRKCDKENCKCSSYVYKTPDLSINSSYLGKFPVIVSE